MTTESSVKAMATADPVTDGEAAEQAQDVKTEEAEAGVAPAANPEAQAPSGGDEEKKEEEEEASEEQQQMELMEAGYQKKISKLEQEVEILRSTLERSQMNYDDLNKDFNKLFDLYRSAHVSDLHMRSAIRGAGDVASLAQERERLEEDLSGAKFKLQKAEEKEQEVKSKLGLPGYSNHQAVLDKIQNLRRGTEITAARIKDLDKKYAEALREKTELRVKCDDLEKEICTVGLRQKQEQQNEDRQSRRDKLDSLQQRFIGGGASSRGRSDTGETVVTSDVSLVGLGFSRASYGGFTPSSRKLPYISSASSSRASPRNTASVGPRQRCVLCGESYVEALDKDKYCQVHAQTCKDGKWGCCQSTASSPGCLRVRHLRLETGAHKKLQITDGVRVLQM